ncbi:MAG: response regulator [Myxococcales bacterium]|nr:response regulator [Myxococcales bacterium]
MLGSTHIAEDTGEEFHVLLVEDNDDHAELFRRVLGRIKQPILLTRVADGHEALEYLRERGVEDAPERPDLVLLDLKLPRIEGHKVLAEIKNDPRLKRLPVVIMSTSNAPIDVRRAYDEHANSYLVKPIDPTVYRNMVEAVVSYWRKWNTAPAD